MSINYKKILKIILPVLPHFASECLDELGASSDIKWPVVDQNYLKSTNHKIVVQINGKKRLLFNCTEDLSEKNLIEKLKETKEIQKYTDDKVIIKTIFIKNKLINLILND